MNWWDSFVTWIEVSPWRFGIVIAVVAAPFVAILTAATEKGRQLAVKVGVYLWKQAVRLTRFMATIRVTTTKRIEREYDSRREAELEELEHPDYTKARVPRGWKLIRGKARALWLLVNETGERSTIESVEFFNDFNIEQAPTLPRTISVGGSLRFYGTTNTHGFLTPRPRISVSWRDTHGDRYTAVNDVIDGAYITSGYF